MIDKIKIQMAAQRTDTYKSKSRSRSNTPSDIRTEGQVWEWCFCQSMYSISTCGFFSNIPQHSVLVYEALTNQTFSMWRFLIMLLKTNNCFGSFRSYACTVLKMNVTFCNLRFYYRKTELRVLLRKYLSPHLLALKLRTRILIKMRYIFLIYQDTMKEADCVQ